MEGVTEAVEFGKKIVKVYCERNEFITIEQGQNLEKLKNKLGVLNDTEELVKKIDLILLYNNYNISYA